MLLQFLHRLRVRDHRLLVFQEILRELPHQVQVLQNQILDERHLRHLVLDHLV
jgi:hypothetical protein